MRRSLAATVLLLAVTAPGAAGQGVQAHIGRFYDDGGWTLYRLGMDRPLLGPLATTVHGDYLRRVGDADGAFAGVGLDLTAFRGGGPYLVAGIGAGMGSPNAQSFSSIWASWSAGGGYELAPASFLRVGFEGRWREISLDHRDGLELSAGISLNLPGGHRPPARTETDPDAPTAIATPATPGAAAERPSTTRPTSATASAQVADSVIATATEVMGRPYKYGGTGRNGGGFDCSGLIQYAYAQHGIALPRRSVDQAREGTKVRKDLEALRPGDLLTFSNRGGAVTHVGMYIGERRFIHSATRGVQVSILSADDPYGRWWHRRWVGVRRIVR